MTAELKRSEGASKSLSPLNNPAKKAVIVFLVTAVATTLSEGMLMHGLLRPHSPFSTLAS